MSKTKEEIELEKSVFGDLNTFETELDNLDLDEQSNSDTLEEDDDLFFIDKGSDSGSDVNGIFSDLSDEGESDVCIWHDSDDDHLEMDLTVSNRTKKLRKSLTETKINGQDYQQRLRSHFLKLHPTPQWALKSNEIKEETEEVHANPLEQLLNKQTFYLKTTKPTLLPTANIDIQRLADITKQQTSKSVVQDIDFHPTQPLLLSCGFDKTLRIYQIDGKNNVLATSLFIENCPFRTAKFHKDGKRVFASGRRRYLFIWNLETGVVEKISRLYGHEYTQSSFEKFELSLCGQYLALSGDNGWMNLLSCESGQYITGAKIEGSIVDLKIRLNEVVIVNKQGDIYLWDLDLKEFTCRLQDPSLVNVTCCATSKRYIAVGMESGIVCVYDMNKKYKEVDVIEPCGIVENLVTPISSMQFSPDGQMLVIASKLKRDAMRIVHIPSFTVFKNWPTSATPLGHVSCLSFSPQNQMLVAGNEGGFIRLWGLNHYYGEKSEL